MPAIERSLPEGVGIDVFYDRTELVSAVIRTVSGALAQGGLFVVLVLFLVIGNLRAALVVALSLPLTALSAFIFMDAADVTANLMSLGGMAIAVCAHRVLDIISSHLGSPPRYVLSGIALSVAFNAAMFWEFGEFFVDQCFGRNMQHSVGNTMRDMLLGAAGATLAVTAIALKKDDHQNKELKATGKPAP